MSGDTCARLDLTAPRWINLAWVIVAVTFAVSAAGQLTASLGHGPMVVELDTIAANVVARLPGGWLTLGVVELLIAGMLLLGSRIRVLGASFAIVFLSAGIGLFLLELSEPQPRACGCIAGATGLGSTRDEVVLDLLLSCGRDAGLMSCLLPVFRTEPRRADGNTVVPLGAGLPAGVTWERQ